MSLLRLHNRAWLCRANALGKNPGRAGLGPAPTKKTQPFCICRRGGCPHPPVLSWQGELAEGQKRLMRYGDVAAVEGNAPGYEDGPFQP